DAHAFGEARLQFPDLLLDPLGDGERILTVAHEDHAARDLVAVLLEDAAAELGPQLYRGDVLDEDGGAVDLLDDGVLDVALVLDPADPAYEVLGVVLLHDPSARGQVAARDGRVEVAERDAVVPQGFGPHVDLVLQGRAADRGDFGHARRGAEL